MGQDESRNITNIHRSTYLAHKMMNNRRQSFNSIFPKASVTGLEPLCLDVSKC